MRLLKFAFLYDIIIMYVLYACINSSKDVKKMAEKKKSSTKKEIKEEKREKKGKGSGTLEQQGKAHQVTFDTPSERLLHQVLPFVFIVLAILLEACFVFASFDGTKHLVGSVGEGLKMAFCGLFGWVCIPLRMYIIYQLG